MILHLTNTAMKSPRQLCTVIRALPANCFTTLCCLVCELHPFSGSNLSKDTVRSAAEHNIVALNLACLIAKAVDTQIGPERECGLGPNLSSRAATEVVKLAIRCFAGDLYTAMLSCLAVMLGDMQANTDTPDEPPAATGGQGPQVSTNPRSLLDRIREGSSSSSFSLDPRVLTSDPELLRCLRFTSAAYQSILGECTSLVLRITEPWRTQRPVAPAQADTSNILACLPLMIQYSALHLARALPEARFRSVFSNISHLGEDIPEFLLLSAVGDRDLEMLRLLLLQTMRQVVERIHAGGKASMHQEDQVFAPRLAKIVS